MRKKTAPIVLALITAAVAIVTPARACQCAPKPSVTEAWQSAERVFLGRVVSVHRVDLDEGYGPFHALLVIFEAETTWKGPKNQEFIIKTGVGSGDCGYPFSRGVKYLVYAYRLKDRLPSTGVCSRTKPAQIADYDIRELNKLTRKRHQKGTAGRSGPA